MARKKVETREDVIWPIIESGDFEKDLIREIHSQSYYEFYKEAYKVLLPGEPYSDNWHIKYLCDRLQEEVFRIKARRVKSKDLIINIPFRSAKSLIVTQCFNAWAWTIDPTLKFICVSFSGALALEHATFCRNLIYSQWYQDLYGHKVQFAEDQNATGHYALKAGGFRKSVGAAGQITGSGADIIIADDIISPKMAASEVERKNNLSFYKETLYSRLNQLELGVRINVQQRVHEEDLSGHLIATNPERYEHICIPVEVDMNNIDKENISPKELIKFYDKNGLFWPNRFSKAVIDEYTKTLGSKAAAGQLYQRPAPKDGDMVKREWFDILDPFTLERDLQIHPMMFYIDTAESEEQKENGDSTAIVTAYKKDNCVYICNIVTVKKAFHELTKFIPIHVQENKYSQFSYVRVEPKSSGKSIVSQLRATTLLNISELPAPKDSKVVRMSSITPLLECRRVKFIKGAYLDNFMSNVLVFPNGKHDDDVDAFIHCVEDLLTGNDFDFTFIE